MTCFILNIIQAKWAVQVCFYSETSDLVGVDGNAGTGMGARSEVANYCTRPLLATTSMRKGGIRVVTKTLPRGTANILSKLKQSTLDETEQYLLWMEEVCGVSRTVHADDDKQMRRPHHQTLTIQKHL
jgi:hypothetical protein